VLQDCLGSMLVSEEVVRSRHLTGTKRRVGHFKYSDVHILLGGGSQSSCAGIEYLTDSKVESVDIKSKKLKLAKGGDDITYDKLIIATGSTVSLLILFCAMLGCNLNIYICACCSLQMLQTRLATCACTLIRMCWDLSSMYFLVFMARPARVASEADHPQALLLVSWVLDGPNPNMA
jgi:predicted flavoprotein YhiN